ncbi:MAG: substrate-binding domain-containing protein, partial [Nitrospirota bacterium]
MEIDRISRIPVYAQLIEIIKGEIRQNNLKPGDKIPSEREFMKRYEVNHVTLSRAMRELVYQGVLYKQHGKGTFVAAPGGEKISISAIAVIVPSVSYFFPPVIRKIEDIAYHSNYNVIVCNTDGQAGKEGRYIQNFINNGCRGLIIKPVYDEDNQNYLKLAHIPFVMLDSPPKGIEADCIVVDDVKGGYDATRHLIECGHKRIACIGTGDVFPRAAMDRLWGYDRALRDSGLEINRELVKITQYLLKGNEEKFSGLIADMLNFENRPTAIFALNDFVAQKVFEIIRDKGIRVPEDIALVGYDDTDIAADVDLPLTSISLPKEEIGEKAILMLIDRIRAGNSGDYKKVVLNHR